MKEKDVDLIIAFVLFVILPYLLVILLIYPIIKYNPKILLYPLPFLMVWTIIVVGVFKTPNLHKT